MIETSRVCGVRLLWAFENRKSLRTAEREYAMGQVHESDGPRRKTERRGVWSERTRPCDERSSSSEMRGVVAAAREGSRGQW